MADNSHIPDDSGLSKSDTDASPDSMVSDIQARIAARAPSVPTPKTIILEESQILRCELENFLGDAKIYAHLYRDKVLYVHQWEKWLAWSGHHWRVEYNNTTARKLVEGVAQEYLRIAGVINERIQGESDMSAEERAVWEKKRDTLLARAKRCRGKDRNAVLDYVHTGIEDPLSIEGNELDADPWLLGVTNGVIDLRDQSFRPGRPDDFVTLAAPTEWQGLDADGTPFMDFLRHMLAENEELVQFALRFLGMALFAGQREHVFLVLFGEGGRNGKDTLMGILRDVLGADLCSDVPPEMFMEQSFVKDAEKPSPILMKFRGKRIVYASESSRRHRFNAETVKRLTGGNSLSARGMHTDNVTTWEMTHTVILLTNELPSAPADDEPFWIRLLGIELTRRYLDNPDPDKPNEFPKDPDMRARIKDCASGVLACLVKGFGDYLRCGLMPPPEVTSFGETYRKQEDVVGRFLEDCCILYEDKERGKTAARELRECFAWWYKENISARHPYPPSKFSNDMRKKGFEVRKISLHFYIGVTITPDSYAEWQANKAEKKTTGKGEKKDE